MQHLLKGRSGENLFVRETPHLDVLRKHLSGLQKPAEKELRNVATCSHPRSSNNLNL